MNRDERIALRGTTRIRLTARFSGADTPKMYNGITRLSLLQISGSGSWGKARYSTHAAPTIPHSLKL